MAILEKLRETKSDQCKVIQSVSDTTKYDSALGNVCKYLILRSV